MEFVNFIWKTFLLNLWIFNAFVCVTIGKGLNTYTSASDWQMLSWSCCWFMNFIILLLDTLVLKKNVRMAPGKWQHNYFCSATSLKSHRKMVVNYRIRWTCSLHTWTSLWWGVEKGLLVPLRRMQFLENSPSIYFID